MSGFPWFRSGESGQWEETLSWLVLEVDWPVRCCCWVLQSCDWCDAADSSSGAALWLRLPSSGLSTWSESVISSPDWGTPGLGCSSTLSGSGGEDEGQEPEFELKSSFLTWLCSSSWWSGMTSSWWSGVTSSSSPWSWWRWSLSGGTKVSVLDPANSWMLVNVFWSDLG